MKMLRNLVRLLKRVGTETSPIEPPPKNIPSDPQQFSEHSYLLCNPDVAQAVSSGAFSSGRKHWVLHGRSENRSGCGVSPYQRRKPGSAFRRPGKIQVAFFGPISAASGLGTAARGYAEALKNPLWNLEIIDSTASLYLHREAGTIEKPKEKPDIIIIHHNPDALYNFFSLAGRDVLDEAYVIGIWVWELAAFRPEWIEHFAAVDEVWAPSSFSALSARSMAPAGFPVHVVPHVIDTSTPPPLLGARISVFRMMSLRFSMFLTSPAPWNGKIRLQPSRHSRARLAMTHQLCSC